MENSCRWTRLRGARSPPGCRIASVPWPATLPISSPWRASPAARRRGGRDHGPAPVLGRRVPRDLGLDAVGPGGDVHPLVLRRDPGGPRDGRRAGRPSSRSSRRRAAAGVPAPGALALLEPDDELGAGFLMHRDRRRDDPPPHPARRRVRRGPPAPRRAVRHDRRKDPRGRSRGAPALPVMARARADRPATHAISTPSASRTRHSSSGCAGSESARRRHGAGARARRLPQRQLRHRRRRRPRRARLGARAPRRSGRGSRLALREVVALRQRRPDRRRLRLRSTDLLDAYARRGATRSTRTRSGSGSCSARVKWGVICIGQASRTSAARCARSSWPRSAAAWPRWNGTCSISSTEAGDDTGPTHRERARRRRTRVPRTRRDAGDRRPRAVPHPCRRERARHRRAGADARPGARRGANGHGAAALLGHDGDTGTLERELAGRDPRRRARRPARRRARARPRRPSARSS